MTYRKHPLFDGSLCERARIYKPSGLYHRTFLKLSHYPTIPLSTISRLRQTHPGPTLRRERGRETSLSSNRSRGLWRPGGRAVPWLPRRRGNRRVPNGEPPPGRRRAARRSLAAAPPAGGGANCSPRRPPSSSSGFPAAAPGQARGAGTADHERGLTGFNPDSPVGLPRHRQQSRLPGSLVGAAASPLLSPGFSATRPRQ